MEKEIIAGGIAARNDLTIATEINLIKRQTAQQCLRATVEIGRLLHEAKELVPHGSWGTWLEENVDYSQSTANNIMRIYTEYGMPEQMGFFEENRLEIFGNLSPSQAVALFALPQAERAAFVESHDMDAMSVRDIQDEIGELKAAKAAAELQKQAAEDQLDKLRKENLQHKEQAEKARRLAETAQKELKREQERSRAEIARIRQEAESKGQQTIAAPFDDSRLREEIKVELEQEYADREQKATAAVRKELKAAQKACREQETRAAQLEAKLTTAGAVAVQKFAVHFEMLQNEFGLLLEIIEGIQTEDEGQAKQLQQVLGKILDTMRATLPPLLKNT